MFDIELNLSEILETAVEANQWGNLAGDDIELGQETET